MKKEKPETWKGKRVLVFKHKEFYGFLPDTQGIVTSETDLECLVRINIFRKVWVFKYDEDMFKPPAAKAGYAKIIFDD